MFSAALFAAAVIIVTVVVLFLHWLSYDVLRVRHTKASAWELNICCGTVDGGGVNADIVRHASLPNFVLIENVYRLPFADHRFECTLCSHTAEHVDDPDEFDRELRRVSKEVVYLLPPLWDLAAAFNILEHRWIFLTWRKRHTELPPRIRLPFAARIQARLGQRIVA